MSHHKGSLSRLTERSVSAFTGDTLFDELARTVCKAACLPRKELYEAWEVARRVRRRFRGGRVVDLAAGHGLLAWTMSILDDSSPHAVAVDRSISPCGRKLAEVLAARWPRLLGRIDLIEADLAMFPIEPGDVVVSAHACGGLTDLVLERAAEAGARVAVLPCCHALGKQDQGGLEGWLDGALAIDVTRAARLAQHGYRVRTQTIPSEITPKNRLLLGEPRPKDPE